MTMPDTPQPDALHLDPTNPAFEQTVIGIIAKKKKVDPATISEASTFEQLGIDSLDGIDLVFTFEDEFNISIPDQVAEDEERRAGHGRPARCSPSAPPRRRPDR
jgi:acyl carrier protein